MGTIQTATSFRMPILVYCRKDPKTPTIRNLHATVNIRTTFPNQKQNDSSNVLCAALSPDRYLIRPIFTLRTRGHCRVKCCAQIWVSNPRARKKDPKKKSNSHPGAITLLLTPHSANMVASIFPRCAAAALLALYANPAVALRI